MTYITTPIPYTNSAPHLGHLNEALFNDAIARFQRRLYSSEVKFSLGLDQNGLKNYQEAQKVGLKIQDFIKRESQKFIDLYEQFEISNDFFTETTSQKHHVVSQIIWQKLVAKKLIYKKTYTGLYCVGCEAFYSPTQLINKKECPIHLKKVVELSEENYFFKLSQFTQQIQSYLQSEAIFPAKMKTEWLNFVGEGLEDVSISRERKNLPWGVAVPDDENQIMYIWFEALINYLTALVDEESCEKYLQFPYQKEEFIEEIWDQIQAGLPIFSIFLGNDIARFHLIMWPAILTALDLPLTKHNLIHGMINDKNGLKMSKSLGNGVYPSQLVEKFGVEGTRFILFMEVNNFDDTNFDWERVTASYNANLADNLGNLTLRVANLVEKYLNGHVDLNSVSISDSKLLKVDLNEVYQSLNEFNTQKSIRSIFHQCQKLNQFLEEQKPWILGKDLNQNLDQITKILTLSVVALTEIAKALSIFMPATGDKILTIFESENITKPEPLFLKVELEQ